MFSLDALCFGRATSPAFSAHVLAPIFHSPHTSALILSCSADAPYSRFKGLRETRGRWEACIEEGSRQAKLMFASEEEAAKAYDKAQYKIYGDEAETNFDLSENEKEEVSELEWEDLVLDLQLQGLPKATLSGLTYHGVLCKNDLWHTHVKIGKKRYVGHFTSMMDAVNAYDMVEYKLHGNKGLLNYNVTDEEAAELKETDWDSLISKLGLKINERRKPQKTGYRGVREVASGKWSASYTYRGILVQLGRFDSIDAAVKSYDSFAYKLCGEDAKLNTYLEEDEKDRLSKLTLREVRAILARQAVRPPSSVDLGARGARLVKGKWEVCVESTMRDTLFLATTSNEKEAMQIHDILRSQEVSFRDVAKLPTLWRILPTHWYICFS